MQARPHHLLHRDALSNALALQHIQRRGILLSLLREDPDVGFRRVGEGDLRCSRTNLPAALHVSTCVTQMRDPLTSLMSLCKDSVSWSLKNKMEKASLMGRWVYDVSIVEAI